jgi:NADP-dependent 3-hydroxy acid dehydrogenase YdfG
VTADYIANAKFGAYSMTKHAVERLLEALRLELHPKNIRVSTIAPGLVDTPIYDKLPNFGETRRRMSDQVPRWLSADDVADAIVWVLSRPPHLAVTELTLMPATQTR